MAIYFDNKVFEASYSRLNIHYILVYSFNEDFLINIFIFFFQDMQTLLISDDDEQSVVGDVVKRTVAEDDDSAGKVFSYLAASLQDINIIILLFYYRQ